MSLLDAVALGGLQKEFRQSMRMLLVELCHDIDTQYAALAERFHLPTAYFRFLAQSFNRPAYSNWKVVGWIEALNDLVYFLDLVQQLRKARKANDQRAFARDLFAECEHRFFENSYLEDLFPRAMAHAKGLEARLQQLCEKLARDITQESLFFDPRWAMQWTGRQGTAVWSVSGSLDYHFERAEAALTLPIGTEGRGLVAPASVAAAIGSARARVTFHLTRHGIVLKTDRASPICTWNGRSVRWHWRRFDAVKAGGTPYGSLTIGPTLRYGKNREPKTVTATPFEQVARIARAVKAIGRAWPQGHDLLELLTSRVIPLKATGVVSFSYRHRPGLSFINCFDRDNLDLIDDLVHENSHHHLNLLLRKHVLYHRDHQQQIFYSPWRRSLRPVHGILHAAFTFTMGALLFEKLSSWAETRNGMKRWKEAGLTRSDLLRARFRCLEEIESVRYSIRDLDYAGRHLKWITGSGARLVRQLEEAINRADQNISRHRRAILASRWGPALRKHIRELREARDSYGPVRLSPL